VSFSLHAGIKSIDGWLLFDQTTAMATAMLHTRKTKAIEY
jgi:hypothetical protein